MIAAFAGFVLSSALASILAAGDVTEPENGQATITRLKLDKTFNDSLKRIAKRHADCSNPVRDFLEELEIQRDPSREYVVVSALPIPKSTASTDGKCLSSIRILRRQYAEQLFRMVDRAIDANNENLAYRLLHEVSLHDPDHKIAKTVTRNRVYSKTVVKAKLGRSSYPDFDWPAKSFRYVNSAHFSVVTNASAEEATTLVHDLELLSNAWRQIFFEHWSSNGELTRAVRRGTPLKVPQERFRVALFKNEAEYLRVVRKYEPRAPRTSGIYIPSIKTSFFYVTDPSKDDGSWKHEATHQLFDETSRFRQRGLQLEHNYWLLEGIAIYMESLQLREGYSMVGGLEANRLQFARYRRLADLPSSIPLKELTSLRKTEVQQRDDISSIYSQAAAVTHYLMRDNCSEMMRSIETVYSGRSARMTLDQMVEKPFSELESGYRGYLKINDRDLQQLDPRATVANLSAGYCDVSDAGFVKVPYENLRWLDLNFTKVTDNSLKRLRGASNLRQLFLRGTQVTDATVKQLANATKLEELDLAGTRVTDDSVETLLRMPNLKSIDVSETKISDANQERLLRRFPD